MKPWPADGKPLLFDDLKGGVVKAMHFAYDLKRKNQGKSIPITGPDSPETSNGSKVSYLLKARQLRYAEERGRDALSEILGFAISLGIEQGRRLERQAMEEHLRVVRMMVDGAHDLLHDRVLEKFQKNKKKRAVKSS